MYIKPWILLSLFFLAGCSLYQVDIKDVVSSAIFPPKESIEKVVYSEKVDKPYDIVGFVDVTAERSSPREEVILKMRGVAATFGADAITDVVCDNAPIRARYTAKAIVFK